MNNQRRKGFKIEPFKVKKVVGPQYGDNLWEQLEHAILQIFNRNSINIQFEDLYRAAFSMVLHKYGEKLYSGLVATTTARVKEISESIEATQGGSFLEELDRNWAGYNKALHQIRDALMYMERTFVPRSNKTPVYELGVNLWRDNVIHSSNIQPRLLNSLLDLVFRERIGEVINRGLMRNVLEMFMDLGPSVYQDVFELPFLEASASFYHFESRQLIEYCDCSDYLKRAERRLNEEIERVSHYLDLQSEKRITMVVEREMIDNHMLRLVHMENSGLVNMLLNDKYEDLGRMYNLFRRVPNGLTTVQDVMNSHIRDTGKQLVTDPERVKDPVEFVQRLLDEKDKYDKIICSAFCNDEAFQNALNSSFEYFISLNPPSAEVISLFLDRQIQ